MFNLAQVYQEYDAAQSAMLRNKLSENQLAEYQRKTAQDEQDRQKKEANEAELRQARAGAWNGDQAALSKLASLDVDEAKATAEYRDGLIRKGREAEVEKAAAEAKALAQDMAWIKNSPDPEEAAARWGYVRENSATGGELPEQFDPRMVDMLIGRSMEVGDILSMGRSEQARAAMNSAFSQQPDPRGPQGGIQPSANPAGLDPRIIGAVDSGGPSPLGATLAGSESGGSFTAQNNVPGSGGTGHFGRGQFSIGRLEDAKRAGVIPGDMSPDQFMASPDAQQRVEQWHVDDIKQGIRDRGLDRFVGQTLNGVPVTEQGMINVAHLGGQGGLAQFMQSGGKYDPADANGTKLSDYLAMGARDAQAQQGDPMSNPRVAQLMQMASDPNLTDAQKGMLGELLKSFTPGEGVKPTSDMQNYQAGLKDPGFANYMTGKNQGQTINVNTGDDPSGTGKFYAELDKKAAESIGSILEGAPAVMRTGQQIGMLDEALNGRVGPDGKRSGGVATGGAAVLKQMAGRWGIPTDGLSDIQAAQALINQIVPTQRAPGSGSMSDADLELFKQSLPTLMNTPGGNQQIIATMRAINEYDTRMVEIANAVANRKMTPSAGRDAMAALQNPLQEYRDAGQPGQPGSPGAAAPALEPVAYRWTPESGLVRQ